MSVDPRGFGNPSTSHVLFKKLLHVGAHYFAIDFEAHKVTLHGHRADFKIPGICAENSCFQLAGVSFLTQILNILAYYPTVKAKDLRS